MNIGSVIYQDVLRQSGIHINESIILIYEGEGRAGVLKAFSGTKPTNPSSKAT